MNLTLQKLREHPKAIEKYKNREVKIFHGFLRLWFVTFIPCTLYKKAASIHTLEIAIKMCEFYHNESDVQFFFVDAFGDDTFQITDFDSEDVYNCSTVHFDFNSKPIRG